MHQSKSLYYSYADMQCTSDTLYYDTDYILPFCVHTVVVAI